MADNLPVISFGKLSQGMPMPHLLDIQTRVTFGLLTRNIHRWGAHLMVFFVFLHMMRVFYHGAYKPPREFNWVVGVLLLVITFLLSFTGHVLDELRGDALQGLARRHRALSLELEQARRTGAQRSGGGGNNSTIATEKWLSLSAAPHTITIRWKVSSGTGTAVENAVADVGPIQQVLDGITWVVVQTEKGLYFLTGAKYVPPSGSKSSVVSRPSRWTSTPLAAAIQFGVPIIVPSELVPLSPLM